ncbi:MAG: hypothetical protein V4638_00540 [Bacteroidota bacterium]
MKLFFSLIFLVPFLGIFGQKNSSTIRIDKELKEISGLEQFNDSLLVAMNDSGNQPLLYFVNFKGQIIQRTFISNAINNDWEDLAMDDQRNLYIGDFGNNLNQRKNLAVLKLNIDSAFQQDTIKVEFIYFSYEEQTSFPPEKGQRIFDCESMAWHNGNLVLITKNTDKKAMVANEYRLSTIPGSYQIEKAGIHACKGTLKDQFTGMDFDQNTFYLLTYKRLQFNNRRIKFHRLTQKEAVLKLNDGRVLIASERNFLLGGPFFHFMDIE